MPVDARDPLIRRQARGHCARWPFRIDHGIAEGKPMPKRFWLVQDGSFRFLDQMSFRPVIHP